jgi:tRNA threonylcarbamoyladenosine biosynthesis protein TsaB
VLDSAAGAILASESVGMLRGHAEAIMPMIARVMDAARCEFADLDRVAVTVGPGSFTGLRVGIAAARGIALASAKPAIGLSTLSAFAAPHVAARSENTIIAAIDARNEQVYFHVFAPNGTTIVPPRLDRVRAAVRSVPVGPTVITGSGAALVAAHWPSGSPAPRVEVNARPTSLGRAAWCCRAGRRHGAEAALLAPARCAPAGRRPATAPMMAWFAGLFARAAPALSTATPRDAASLAALHAASFNRGLERTRIRAASDRPQRDC